MDEKRTSTEDPAAKGTEAPREKGRKRKKRKRPVEVQRRFEIDDLPRDEDGKVILPDDITYPEFIRLTHPEMSDAEINKALRKEHRNTVVVRFEIAAFIVLIILIIVLVVTS